MEVWFKWIFLFKWVIFRFKHHLSLSGVYVGDEIPVVLGLFHKPSGQVKIFHQPGFQGPTSLPKSFLLGGNNGRVFGRELT